MITVDALHKAGGKPYYMGLGIVKIFLPSDTDTWLCYHFYSDHTEILVDGIHDHKFSFNSKVLKGAIRNWIYHYTISEEETDFMLYQQECRPNAELTVIHENIDPIEVCTFNVVKGQEYNLNSETLHRIEIETSKVITCVTPLEKYFVKPESNRIGDKNKMDSCGYSSPKSNKVCWEIVDYTLAD